MTKEGRKMVKFNASFSSKYVTSDKYTLSSDNYDYSDGNNSLDTLLLFLLNIGLGELDEFLTL
jgi:hypothetical protein